MNAAIIELGGSHDECIFSQVRFLKEYGYTVHLICTSNLEQQVSEFADVDHFVFFDFEKAGSVSSIYKLIQIRRYLIKNNITQVIFNTAEGNLVRTLTLLPFPSKINFSGIIHNGHKLLKSSSQRIISRRVKKYFVLNDYILPHLNNIDGISVESFYPIFFPEPESVILPKQPDELWVCVPGQVDFNRRDYKGLLRTLKQQQPASKIKFIILGRDNSPGKRLREMVEEADLKHSFVLFNSFIPNSVFHSYLQQSDVILPLMYRGMPKFEQYLRYKISGSINLAFAYKKPLLCEESFMPIPDFKENAIFYTTENLSSVLERLAALLEEKKQHLYKHPKWHFSYQQQKYISFIE